MSKTVALSLLLHVLPLVFLALSPARAEEVLPRAERERIFAKVPGLSKDVAAMDELDRDMLLLRAVHVPLAKLVEQYPKIPRSRLKTLKARARPLIDPKAAPRDAGAFAGVSEEMTLGAIVARLGPASADVGSGLHVYVWKCGDGRRFLVGTPDADPAQRPLYARWEAAPVSGRRRR